MHLPQRLTASVRRVLATMIDNPDDFAGMIRPTADPKFGDYQCNCAMPLAQKIGGKNPRQIATELVAGLMTDPAMEELCQPPEIAGPGFINLTLKDSWILRFLGDASSDPRCGVDRARSPRKILIDFSSPNVAKPMHVGHIRSTVIGDCLSRTLRFLGHDVVTDNHLGDWGTQFGIIIYGYKHFGEPAIVDADPVPELAKLYRIVNQLIEIQKAQNELTAAETLVRQLQQVATQSQQDAQEASVSAGESIDPKAAAKLRDRHAKEAAAARKRYEAAAEELQALQQKVDAAAADAELSARLRSHPDIAANCLAETAKLHAGDPENLQLWDRFLPHCKDEINRVYDRLNVKFDHTLGESFYHDMLAGVVDGLLQRGLATYSDDAVCVFLQQFDAPMIIRKSDGAFLYATTDLATLEYRMREFAPDEILYVVDTRQGEHFEKLFAVARATGIESAKLVHVNFGTVLGEDGRPLKTRSGTLIGLEGLLDDAVARAAAVVCDPQRLEKMEPAMPIDEQQLVAETVGIGAIKYADLSHQRTSDYRFSLDKMVALDGNTATYIQYSYARTQSILRRAETSPSIDSSSRFTHPAERALAIKLIQFEEALTMVYQEYAPNHLAQYLYETARSYAVFNESCPVLKADDQLSRQLRLALVQLCGDTLRKGLELLGIGVVPRM